MKRTVLRLVSAGLALVAFVLTLSGCSQSNSEEISPLSPPEPKEIALLEGQSLIINELTYRLNGSRYTKFVKNYWGPNRPAQTENLFLLVSITILNQTRAPKDVYLPTWHFRIRDEEGNIYESQDKNSMENRNRMQDYLMLNPKVGRTFDLAFEVPTQKKYILEYKNTPKVNLTTPQTKLPLGPENDSVGGFLQNLIYNFNQNVESMKHANNPPHYTLITKKK